jgi:hypothetical protein
MKEAWKEEIHKFEELHGKVTKGYFTEVLGKAFSPNPLSELPLNKQAFTHFTLK